MSNIVILMSFQTIYSINYGICKALTCTSLNVVYLAQCAACGLQGVGSTVVNRVDGLETH